MGSLYKRDCLIDAARAHNPVILTLFQALHLLVDMDKGL